MLRSIFHFISAVDTKKAAVENYQTKASENQDGEKLNKEKNFDLRIPVQYP